MGIVQSILSRVSLEDSRLGEVEVEWNAGNVVHLQSEGFRLELSKAEYLKLAAACAEAAAILRERKGETAGS